MPIERDLLRKAWPDGYLPSPGVQTLEGWHFVAHDVILCVYGIYRRRVERLTYRIIHHKTERHADLQAWIDAGDLLPNVNPADIATWACLKAELAEAEKIWRTALENVPRSRVKYRVLPEAAADLVTSPGLFRRIIADRMHEKTADWLIENIPRALDLLEILTQLTIQHPGGPTHQEIKAAAAAANWPKWGDQRAVKMLKVLRAAGIVERDDPPPLSDIFERGQDLDWPTESYDLIWGQTPKGWRLEGRTVLNVCDCGKAHSTQLLGRVYDIDTNDPAEALVLARIHLREAAQ